MTDGLIDLWDRFPAERILHRDDDIIVIDKPWGLATHPPEPERTDDVVSWLQETARHTDKDEYFGIHQRLDRETSGVLLFSKRKSANPSLAKQFEGRSVDKEYIALVEGGLGGKKELTLEHYLSADKDGDMRARPVRGPAKKGEKIARATVRVLERRAKLALVAVKLETGRTHQVRVQLAAAGAPVVGDLRYGGARGTRLFLHASKLSLAHPGSNAPVSFEAPVPNDFARTLGAGPISATTPERSTEVPSEADLVHLFREAAERRYGIPKRGETTAFRLVNAEGDGVPGITLDLYGEHGVLSFYIDVDDDTRARVARAAMSLGLRGVYAKHRPKDASRLVETRREEVAPREAILGESAPEAFVVHENGIPFEVRLGDGLSTGIFLDQREHRKRVRGMSKGLRVLNLFAYTGAFSVAAAVGGAKSSVTVDVSRGSLDWADASLARVGADPNEHTTFAADVFDYLGRAQKKGERFDLVILDPPSFSTTKKSRWSAADNYAELAAQAIALTERGGSLLASTNHRGIGGDRFRRSLHEALRMTSRQSKSMKSLAAPVDFPPAPGEESHLKSVLLTMAD